MKSFFYILALIGAIGSPFTSKKWIQISIAILTIISIAGLWYFDYKDSNQIISLSAFGEIRIESLIKDSPDPAMSNSYVVQGSTAALVFVKNEKPLLLVRSEYVKGNQNLEAEIVTVNFSLTAPGAMIDGQINDIESSDYAILQLPNEEYKESRHLESGQVVVTINGDQTIRLEAVAQDFQEGKIIFNHLTK